MSWVKMTMKFPGKCTVCGKTVDTGQVGFWARGMAVKHDMLPGCMRLEATWYRMHGGDVSRNIEL